MLLEIENLKFKWPKSQSDLIDIQSLKINEGESIFLHGPSGSGKTTLLNLISGIVTPSSGAIRIMEHDLSHMSESKRDNFRGDHMGFIFQQFNLVPYLSPLENIVLTGTFSKRKSDIVRKRSKFREYEAKRLLEALQLKDEELMNRPSSNLSVGQQQRVAAARALYGAPELIIADEPTSALDRENQEGFLKLLFSECKERKISLVFVSHDQSLGDFFDRKVSLKEINRAAQNISESQ